MHRELKPVNLMLSSPAKNDPDSTLACTVKILDVGLGRVLNDKPDSGDPLTAEGTLVAAPDYLAPEQARDPASADIRGDIYSLGCVLYHCLTGQPPFLDTNVLSQIVRHATETPKPLRELTPEVPEGLQQVLNGMLAKEPAKRYATPDQAAKALQPFSTGGAAASAPEENPQLKKFLTWLEMNTDSRGAGLPAAEPSPRPAPAKPGPPAPPPASEGGEFDVELVSTTPETPTGALPSTNRDWYFLALGAGGVIAAGVIGFLMAWSMRG